jgi:hypothetical protein
MVNQKNIILFATICLAGLIAFWWLYESDEAKIRKRFDALAEEAAKVSDETELAAALKAKKLSDMCADPFTVKIPSYSISRIFPKSDIAANILAARAHYASIAVKFYDITIEFPEEGIANVALTASVKANMVSGERVDEIQELQCRLEKIEKDWLFAKIEEVDVLQK